MIFPKTQQTTAAAAAHYDELDDFYRDIWGQHVHHGYWETGRETPAAAVLALIDLLASRLDLAPGQQLCDIGCGYGATARHLATRHGVHVTGLTVSVAQARHAATPPPPTSPSVKPTGWPTTCPPIISTAPTRSKAPNTWSINSASSLKPSAP